jgi:hypothetical protein
MFIRLCTGLLSATLLFATSQAASQEVQGGRVAESSVGRVGQRQTRADAAPNVQPLDRIDTRIGNRVQSRIRNRIDRNYNPQANALSPFRIAEDEARSARR